MTKPTTDADFDRLLFECEVDLARLELAIAQLQLDLDDEALAPPTLAAPLVELEVDLELDV